MLLFNDNENENIADFLKNLLNFYDKNHNNLKHYLKKMIKLTFKIYKKSMVVRHLIKKS